MNEHRRSVRLPFAYAAEFVFRSNPYFFEVFWSPDRPHIRNPRAWRKFFAAYTAERDDFLRDAATMLGGAVLVADVGGNLGGITVIKQAVRH